MKTAILTAAMMILMTVTLNARTTDDNVNPGTPGKVEFKVTIGQPNSHMISFRVANPSEDKVVLKIYNDRNIKVFHKVTKNKKEYNVGCDMTNVNSGLYTAVVLRDGEEIARKQVVILN
jgi:hypothetical protein